MAKTNNAYYVILLAIMIAIVWGIRKVMHPSKEHLKFPTWKDMEADRKAKQAKSFVKKNFRI